MAGNEWNPNNGLSPEQRAAGMQIAGNAMGEADRLQKQGRRMDGRRAYRQDWTESDAYGQQAQGARDTQLDAVNLAQAAAYGNAPSAAQSLGQNMLDQSLQAQMAGAASARGGALAQAAAARGAASQAGVMQMQGANQLAAMRAQEMAQARGDYSQMAGQMRGQDFQAQQIAQQKVAARTQNQQFQRSLNQQGQMGYEGMAQGVYGQQLGANVQVTGMEAQAEQAELQRQWQSRENEKSFWRNLGGQVVGGIAGGAAFGLASDVRAKEPAPTLASPSMVFAAPGDAVAPTKDAGLGSQMLKGVGSALSGGGPAPKSLGEAAVAGFASAKSAPVPQMAMPVIQVPQRLALAPVQMDRVPEATPVPMMSDDRAKLAAGIDGGTLRTPSPAFAAPPKSQMADAARAMQGSAYTYKPELTPQDQAPGEVNVGPMAQEMAKNPVTATAVKQNPENGMLMLDQGKMTRILGSVAASQQDQIDGLAAAVAKKGGR
jgi:hypothetical protein